MPAAGLEQPPQKPTARSTSTWTPPSPTRVPTFAFETSSSASPWNTLLVLNPTRTATRSSDVNASPFVPESSTPQMRTEPECQPQPEKPRHRSRRCHRASPQPRAQRPPPVLDPLE